MAFCGKQIYWYRSNKLLYDPIPCEPPTSSESFYPRIFIYLYVARARYWYIWEVDVAFRCIAVPTKHGIDGFGKFRKVWLVDAACINPEILQSILCRLLTAKVDLSVAAEIGRGAMEEILEVTSPSPHVWERIAYWGILCLPNSVQARLPSSWKYRSRMNERSSWPRDQLMNENRRFRSVYLRRHK